MKKHLIKISVRELIEYTLRNGSISSVFLSSARAVDGIRAHQKFQNSAGNDYEKEVSVAMEVDYDRFTLLLQGRIDGVIKEKDGIIIDEIKSTGGRLEDIEKPNEMHLYQVKMYAYMYSVLNDLSQVAIRVTYIELEDFKIKQFQFDCKIEELCEFFDDVINRYVAWLNERENFKEICYSSIETIKFPFDDYREGQRKLMGAVYKTIEEQKRLFSRAPTGIGKTVATLFPAIKALSNDKTTKIFYLTAKTIGKEVAIDTLNLLDHKGLRIKRVIITAKDKVCLNDVTTCNENECPYAKGHYDRVNGVIEEMYIRYDCFDRALIEKYSRENKVCPYELSLDLAVFSEVVICDYNYVFDPVAALKRFFVEGDKKYTLLIDEAHNLVDRSREMYSSSIEKQNVLSLQKKVKNLDKRLFKYLNQLNKIMIDYRKECAELKDGVKVTKDCPYEIENALRGIIYRTEKVFKQHKDWLYIDELLEFYFEAYDFVRKAESYDDNYITYHEKKGQNIIVKMYCIDPSENLKKATDKLCGVVYFSATLLPLNYYVKILGGNEKSYGMALDSPFDPKNLCLLIDYKISTKYIDRERSVKQIIQSVEKVIRAKKGNYIIYFSSYAYMEQVFGQFIGTELSNDIEVVMQSKGLDEKEKEAFIEQFSVKREKSLLVFSVLGGMFSEGVDLKGDKLCCSIIIGVGLPMICAERNMIRDFFNERYMNGFDYAYIYPGMNKVMQSAGRVIRTGTDKGAVILIDTRFNTRQYKRLFPKEWDHYRQVDSRKNIEDYLNEFWQNDNLSNNQC